MYGAEADDSMTARRDCLGSIDMNDGIVRRPRYRGWTRDRYDCSRASPFIPMRGARSKDVRPLMGME